MVNGLGEVVVQWSGMGKMRTNLIYFDKPACTRSS